MGNLSILHIGVGLWVDLRRTVTVAFLFLSFSFYLSLSPPTPHPRRLCYVNADGCGGFTVIFHLPVTRDKRRVTSCRDRPHCSPLSH